MSGLSLPGPKEHPRELNEIFEAVVGQSPPGMVWDLARAWGDKAKLKEVIGRGYYHDLGEFERCVKLIRLVRSSYSAEETWEWFDLLLPKVESLTELCPGKIMAISLSVFENYATDPFPRTDWFVEISTRLILAGSKNPDRRWAGPLIESRFEGGACSAIKRATQFHMRDKVTEFLCGLAVRRVDLGNPELTQHGKFVLNQMLYACFGALTLEERTNVISQARLSILPPKE